MSRSRLVLGTVQLGMFYGVANTTGAPSKEEAFAILDAALDGGINTFDTASTYGTAEEVLGEWIATRKLADSVYVISKIQADAPERIRAELEGSLKRMQLERLDGCLLHAAEHMYEKGVIAGLQEAKQSGLFEHNGVSVYDETDALRAVELGMEYIQVPYNAFDQRLDRTDFFERAEEKGVTVFARSPFLQGLLLMDPDDVPPYLSAARSHIARFIDVSRRYDLSPFEASLLFAYKSRAEHVIFGAESCEQIADILFTIVHKQLSVDFLKEIHESFQNIERSVIDPRLWKRQN